MCCVGVWSNWANKGGLGGNETTEQKIQEVAKHYTEKYKEANEVLKLCNTEKTSLLREKEEWEKKKTVLEQQVPELS